MKFPLVPEVASSVLWLGSVWSEGETKYSLLLLSLVLLALVCEVSWIRYDLVESGPGLMSGFSTEFSDGWSVTCFLVEYVMLISLLIVLEIKKGPPSSIQRDGGFDVTVSKYYCLLLW